MTQLQKAQVFQLVFAIAAGLDEFNCRFYSPHV
jgi:hypothetical protein